MKLFCPVTGLFSISEKLHPVLFQSFDELCQQVAVPALLNASACEGNIICDNVVDIALDHGVNALFTIHRPDVDLFAGIVHT